MLWFAKASTKNYKTHNPKYPGGIEYQKNKLIGKGHEIHTSGRKNTRYFVRDFENNLYHL